MHHQQWKAEWRIVPLFQDQTTRVTYSEKKKKKAFTPDSALKVLSQDGFAYSLLKLMH